MTNDETPRILRAKHTASQRREIIAEWLADGMSEEAATAHAIDQVTGYQINKRRASAMVASAVKLMRGVRVGAAVNAQKYARPSWTLAQPVFVTTRAADGTIASVTGRVIDHGSSHVMIQCGDVTYSVTATDGSALVMTPGDWYQRGAAIQS